MSLWKADNALRNDLEPKLIKNSLSSARYLHLSSNRCVGASDKWRMRANEDGKETKTGK